MEKAQKGSVAIAEGMLGDEKETHMVKEMANT
jgi:hypothetical protein